MKNTAIFSRLIIILFFLLSANANSQDREFSPHEERVLQAYLAYYGRPADPDGLAYWAGRLEDEGGDLSTIIDAFGESQEYQDRYGSLSNSQLVTNLYDQLFGREPDEGGLAFYVDKLDAGDWNLQKISLVILDGVQGEDVNIVDNRLTFSKYYVENIENGSVASLESDALLVLISGIDEDYQSVEAAIARINLEEAQDFPLPELLSPGEIQAEFGLWSGDVENDPIWDYHAVDLDGDGDDDVIVLSGTGPWEEFEGGRYGVILLNNGDYTFTPAAGDRPFSAHPREYLTADFDNNGMLDVFIADHGWDAGSFPGFQNQLLLQTPEGFVDVTERLPPDPSGFTHNAAVGDLDGDGDIDICVANNGGGGGGIVTPYFLINDGAANFIRTTEPVPQQILDDYTLWPWAVDLADLDGDGFTDFIVGASARGSGESRVYWGSEDGVFVDDAVTLLSAPESHTVWGATEVIVTLVTDLNGDGLEDLILGAYDTGIVGTYPLRGIQLLINEGNRTFSDQTRRRMGDSAYSLDQGWQVGYRLFDFNGDGTIDIVPQFYDPANNGIIAWLNDGTGHYAALEVDHFDDAEATFRLATGVYVLVDDDFKALEFSDWDGLLGVNGASVVSGAIITLPD